MQCRAPPGSVSCVPPVPGAGIECDHRSGRAPLPAQPHSAIDKLRSVVGAGMQIRLLGPVEVYTGAGPLDAGTTRQRCVLAALAVDAGRPVPVDMLVDRVW